MPTIHYFVSTGQAYDACQCDPTVKTGDTLVIQPEQVVGIADTWPVAVTRAAGALHRKAPDAPWAQLAEAAGFSPEAITQAQMIALNRGWPVGNATTGPTPALSALAPGDLALIRRALETHLTLAKLTRNEQDETRTQDLLKRLA